ncbi:LPS-assembly protein LptD [Comamonas serinivorans]
MRASLPPPRPSCLTPTALACWLLCVSGAVFAQAAPDSAQPAFGGLGLRATPSLQEQVPEGQSALIVTGDELTNRSEFEMGVRGNAQLRRPGLSVRANELHYDQFSDQATATGQVHINQQGNEFSGDRLRLRLNASQGDFSNVNYKLLANGAHGVASQATFLDSDRTLIDNATYSTCPIPTDPNAPPPWVLTADHIELDTEAQVGRASGAKLQFYGLTVLPLPNMSFPLSSNRKSGWLPPTFGLNNRSGFELTAPYYFNIAPNRDAMLFPTLLSKRGVNLGGQFRYLEDNYRGSLTASVLPGDRLANNDTRWSYALQHSHDIQTGIEAVGNLGLNLNLNRVSDDQYWRDFPRENNSAAQRVLTQRLLNSEGTLTWNRGDFSLLARAQKWQTLQDVSAPIVPPYDRLPQLAGRWAKSDFGPGLQASVDVDYTKFRADRAYTGQPNAERSFARFEISRPWEQPGWFITPKMQYHASTYRFDAPLADGRTSYSRSLPTFSLDGGLRFEREAKFGGQNYTMTLEPRSFYTYTPYRDQSQLPVYDTAAYDFNFATIYTENAFVGNDRIADNHSLTTGVTSRLLDAETGAEKLAVGIAQRYRFKDQRVTMPGVDAYSERLSDILVGGRVSWNPRWSVDSVVQYNPKLNRSIRSTIGARYSPSPYRTVSMAYRLQRGQSEQVDVGWQWPINDLWGDKGENLGAGRGQGSNRWYSVGRLNYSLRDSRLVDAVVGFEYDACCWIGRVVFERLQSTTVTATKRVLFQIEFVGFARVGSNPLQTLKDNVPRYQYLRETVETPSRFSNYE